jgi:hypothetical protein
MTIQATARSALMLAAALVAAIVLGLTGTGASYAATNGTMQLSTDATASDNAPATPATADANAAPYDQQTAPAPSFPLAGNALADNSEPAAATASDATASTVSVSNDDSSGWDKASIIGKIFIACGTLLTLGSAARMFMI